MSGITDKMSGKVKQTAGRATGDDRMKNEGRADETKGKIKEGLNKAIDSISEKMESSKTKRTR